MLNIISKTFKNIFMKNRSIPNRYYNELNDGHTVPRNEMTGDVIPFRVGKEYNIVSPGNKEVIRARCTQNCPYHLKKID